jgi:hypothetical protein
MKDINEINNKNKIDLESLNNFLIKKGDSELDFLLQVNEYKKITDNSSERIHDYFLEKPTKTVPKELWNNYSFCKKAVSNDGAALEFVPENLPEYYSLCEKALSNDGFAIKYVSENIPEYYSLCYKAVSNDGAALKDVHIDFIDYPLCEKAMSNYGDLKYVPEEFINYTLVKLAYKNSRYNTKQFIIRNLYKCKEYIPQLVKDFPEDKEYFKRYLLQEYISKQVKKLLKENIERKFDFESDKEFLLQNLGHLRHLTPNDVPYYEDLVKACIDFDPESIKKLNKEYVTSEIYNYFLTKYPRLLDNNHIMITENINLDKVLVKKILRKYPDLVKNLPEQLMTYEFLSVAISSFPYALWYIDVYRRNYKLCKLAVSKNPATFYYVPIPKKITKKLYRNINYFEMNIYDTMNLRQYLNILKIVYQKDKKILEYSPIPQDLINKIANNTI